MSVLIKGMEMPENCMDCKIKQYSRYEGECVCPFSRVACLSIGRQDACPFVDVPTPHGRLIDADGLTPDIVHDWNGYTVPKDDYSWECIHNAPTVIEAEVEHD